MDCCNLSSTGLQDIDASRSGLVSEAGTDRAILYIIATASPARWLGPGARHRTGRCYCSRDSPGAPAARYAPGFDDSDQTVAASIYRN